MSEKFIEKKIKDMPSSLGRTVLSTLIHHFGKNRALPRKALLSRVNLMGWQPGDRGLRDEINALRKNGVLICSTGGAGGGYYFAENWTELEEYLEHEVIARIADLSEQRKALELGGKKMWGENSPQIDLL